MLEEREEIVTTQVCSPVTVAPGVSTAKPIIYNRGAVIVKNGYSVAIKSGIIGPAVVKAFGKSTDNDYDKEIHNCMVPSSGDVLEDNYARLELLATKGIQHIVLCDKGDSVVYVTIKRLMNNYPQLNLIPYNLGYLTNKGQEITVSFFSNSQISLPDVPTIPFLANIFSSQYNLKGNLKFLMLKDAMEEGENPRPRLLDEKEVLAASENNPEVTICSYCNFETPDPNLCQRCRRTLIPDTVVAQTVTIPHTCTSTDNSLSQESSHSTKSDKGQRSSDHKRRKCSRKIKKPAPAPEPKASEGDSTVTLSDDDDEEHTLRKNAESEAGKYPDPVTNVFSKEPVITEDTDTPIMRGMKGMVGGGMEGAVDLLDVESPDIERIKLDCRTVRFGSYKVVPTDKIVLTEHGVKMKVPCLAKNSTSVIKIFMRDIVKVLIHFGSAKVSQSAPAMFYYVTHEGSKRIRDALHMNVMSPEAYFDSTSKEELHKRITLLPETISQMDRLFIKSIYESRCLMEELSWDEANDILVRAAPKEVQHTLKKEVPGGKHLKSSADSNIKFLFVYPPLPLTGGYPINTADYACLKEDSFLNDVIIDFYLKYVWLNVLSEEDRNRTYVYSSFFYTRLTNLSSNAGNKNMTPAEKRHARVKKWTKSIDIFEKDFIVIPINERSHWFLGIICFPGLTGPVRMSDGTPIPTDTKKKDTSVLVGGQAPAKIWGTTISVVRSGAEKPTQASRSGIVNVESEDDQEEDEPERNDGSERDEAEADDDDMEPNTTDEEMLKEEDLMDEATPRVSKAKPNYEPIKQPCILIFDSLAHTSRSKVCATLREYLQVEWKARNKGKPRDFSKDVFKGAMPKVPQQTNFIDCGVYVLQYVEAFFKNPITDYRMPIRSIKNWFTLDEVNRKRYDIMQLIHSLMREQNVNVEKLNLPDLDLHPYSQYDGDDDVMDEEGDFDEEMGEGDEENLPEEEEDEEDNDEVYRVIEERMRSKRFEPRLSNPHIEHINRMSTSRMDPSPRQSPRRFEYHSQMKAESIRGGIVAQESKPRIPDSVTICEANSKRKLPLSLKDIRSPRPSPSQTTIKKMRTD